MCSSNPNEPIFGEFIILATLVIKLISTLVYYRIVFFKILSITTLVSALFRAIQLSNHFKLLILFDFVMENSTEFKFHPHTAGKALTSSAKIIIMNVFCKLKEEFSSKSEHEIIEQTSNLTGVSKTAIYRMKDEFCTFGKFSTPGKKRPLKVGTQTRMKKYDDFTLCAIRRKIHEFYMRNEIPTASKVREIVNRDSDLPNFSLSTILRLMKDIGFVYSKRKRNSILIEREDIQQWRRKYLRNIRKFRSEGRPIYYTDETWVNFGHTKANVWQDTTVKSTKQAFLSGLSTGLKSPSGKGSRFILVHAGGELGFVQDAGDLFKAKKQHGDYHGEMNGEYYEHWFEQKLLPNIKDNSVIVMDNAPYHSVRMEKIPTSSSKKSDIQAWLTSKKIDWAGDMIKPELLELVRRVRYQYEEYRIDRLAAQHNHTVLRLPPYHCELNPIENIWGQIKGYVSAENRTFKMDECEKLTQEGIFRITPEQWKKCISHAIKEEEKMWNIDCLSETTIERFVFDVNDNDESSDSLGVEELST